MDRVGRGIDRRKGTSSGSATVRQRQFSDKTDSRGRSRVVYRCPSARRPRGGRRSGELAFERSKSMSLRVDTSAERPLWIHRGREQLLGILTLPNQSRDLGVVLFTGGGWMPSTHRNRMYVDLARDLAGMGCTVMRFDYTGVGNSTGETKYFDFVAPHIADALAAVEAVRATGVKRVIMVGTCYGGRTALAAAKSVADLVGLVLVASPVEDYGGGSATVGQKVSSPKSALKLARTRYPKYIRIVKARLSRAVRVREAETSDPVSPKYLQALSEVLSRGVRVLLLEGTLDKHHPSHVAALNGRLGILLTAHRDLVATAEIDGELHGELSMEGQMFTRERVSEFVASFVS